MSNTALWLLDKTQPIVTTLTAMVVLHTGFSPGAIYFTTGAVAASRVGKGLKLILRQPRPENARKSWTYGMPSTHSTVIIYYATYITLASLYLKPEGYYAWLPQLLPPAIAVPWATTIACSRIWLGHHTVAQVAAGSAVGMTFGLGWFWWWNHGAEEVATELTSCALGHILPWVTLE